MREWLIANDALPDEPLLAQIPVSVRTDEQVGTYGNRISVMIVPIPTDEPDPVQRVMRAQEAMLAAKDRHKAMPAELLQDVTNFIPAGDQRPRGAGGAAARHPAAACGRSTTW